jgi:hypothetical protein
MTPPKSKPPRQWVLQAVDGFRNNCRFKTLYRTIFSEATDSQAVGQRRRVHGTGSALIALTGTDVSRYDEFKVHCQIHWRSSKVNRRLAFRQE